jgi:hypothetical protein
MQNTFWGQIFLFFFVLYFGYFFRCPWPKEYIKKCCDTSKSCKCMHLHYFEIFYERIKNLHVFWKSVFWLSTFPNYTAFLAQLAELVKWFEWCLSIHPASIRLWRSEAIIMLQLHYNDILTVMSILKIVSSYLLFVMSILISLVHNIIHSDNIKRT